MRLLQRFTGTRSPVGVTLRPYRISDAIAMYYLDRLCFAEAFQFSLRVMRWFAESPGAIVVVAESAGKIVGFAIAELTGEASYLVTLDVEPAWRRAGVARRMLAWAEQRALASGARRVELHVHVDNAAAISFYERCGFSQRGRIAGFYGLGLDAFAYIREIPMPRN